MRGNSPENFHSIRQVVINQLTLFQLRLFTSTCVYIANNNALLSSSSTTRNIDLFFFISSLSNNLNKKMGFVVESVEDQERCLKLLQSREPHHPYSASVPF
ncbi:uncharacterized protein LOC141699908 [Apium graveolens]|uniref:uncharacterized protein LOC141699908 n=1 Tax=Apium graveolens TaxID=4045 RepID=UPI003D7AC49B